jgi:hypothetical protein
MALVRHHDAESVSLCTASKDLLRKYVMLKVLRYTGLNYTEFMELPRYMINEIFDVCAEEITKTSNQTDDLLRGLEQ